MIGRYQPRIIFVITGLLMPTTLFAVADDKKACSGNCIDDSNLPHIHLSSGASAIADTLILIVAVLSTFFLVVGGIRFAASNGNQQQIQSAKNTVTYAVAGLVVAILAKAIVGFILGSTPSSAPSTP